MQENINNIQKTVDNNNLQPESQQKVVENTEEIQVMHHNINQVANVRVSGNNGLCCQFNTETRNMHKYLTEEYLPRLSILRSISVRKYKSAKTGHDVYRIPVMLGDDSLLFEPKDFHGVETKNGSKIPVSMYLLSNDLNVIKPNTMGDVGLGTIANWTAGDSVKDKMEEKLAKTFGMERDRMWEHFATDAMCTKKTIVEYAMFYHNKYKVAKAGQLSPFNKYVVENETNPECPLAISEIIGLKRYPSLFTFEYDTDRMISTEPTFDYQTQKPEPLRKERGRYIDLAYTHDGECHLQDTAPGSQFSSVEYAYIKPAYGTIGYVDATVARCTSKSKPSFRLFIGRFITVAKSPYNNVSEVTDIDEAALKSYRDV